MISRDLPGHATAAFAVATTLVVSFPILAPLLLPLAIAVSVSRVVLGVHHTSDVLAGASLGIAAALAVTQGGLAVGA